MPILSPVTDNCLSWISGRDSTEVCCRTGSIDCTMQPTIEMNKHSGIMYLDHFKSLNPIAERPKLHTVLAVLSTAGLKCAAVPLGDGYEGVLDLRSVKRVLMKYLGSVILLWYAQKVLDVKQCPRMWLSIITKIQNQIVTIFHHLFLAFTQDQFSQMANRIPRGIHFLLHNITWIKKPVNVVRETSSFMPTQ